MESDKEIADMVSTDIKVQNQLEESFEEAVGINTIEDAIKYIVKAIESAGFKPGKDIYIALDPAASSFFDSGIYKLNKSGQGKKTSAEMTELYKKWIAKYPIVSIV